MSHHAIPAVGVLLWARDDAPQLFFRELSDDHLATPDRGWIKLIRVEQEAEAQILLEEERRKARGRVREAKDGSDDGRQDVERHFFSRTRPAGATHREE